MPLGKGKVERNEVQKREAFLSILRGIEGQLWGRKRFKTIKLAGKERDGIWQMRPRENLPKGCGARGGGDAQGKRNESGKTAAARTHEDSPGEQQKRGSGEREGSRPTYVGTEKRSGGATSVGKRGEERKVPAHRIFNTRWSRGVNLFRNMEIGSVSPATSSRSQKRLESSVCLKRAMTKEEK